MHDQWIGLLAEKYGTVYLEKKVLLDYRRHEGTATTSHHGTFRFMFNNRRNISKAIRIRCKEIEAKNKEEET